MVSFYENKGIPYKNKTKTKHGRYRKLAPKPPLHAQTNAGSEGVHEAQQL